MNFGSQMTLKDNCHIAPVLCAKGRDWVLTIPMQFRLSMKKRLRGHHSPTFKMIRQFAALEGT